MRRHALSSRSQANLAVRKHSCPRRAGDLRARQKWTAPSGKRRTKRHAGHSEPGTQRRADEGKCTSRRRQRGRFFSRTGWADELECARPPKKRRACCDGWGMTSESRDARFPRSRGGLPAHTKPPFRSNGVAHHVAWRLVIVPEMGVQSFLSHQPARWTAVS